MKRLLIPLAAVGIGACFAAIGHGATLSDGHRVDVQMFYRVLVALGLVLAIGCTRGPLRALDAAVAAAACVFVLIALRHDLEIARTMFVCTALALAATVAGFALSLRTASRRPASRPESAGTSPSTARS